MATSGDILLRRTVFVLCLLLILPTEVILRLSGEPGAHELVSCSWRTAAILRGCFAVENALEVFS